MSKKRLDTFVALSMSSFMVGVIATGCSSKTWDYVALGDSYPHGHEVEYSYVDYYAEHIEQDLGVDVEVHNFARDGQTIGALREFVYEDEELRIAIKDAEVITIWTGWNDLWRPLEKYRRETCGGEDNLDCIRAEVAIMNSDFDAVLDEILSLTSTQDTLIRIADYGIPHVNSWKHKGWFDTLVGPCYETWRDHLVEAAEKRGITVVYTYHVLNGPTGDLPMDESITLDDRVHLNEEGHRLVAQLHREVGYDFAP